MLARKHDKPHAHCTQGKNVWAVCMGCMSVHAAIEQQHRAPARRHHKPHPRREQQCAICVHVMRLCMCVLKVTSDITCDSEPIYVQCMPVQTHAHRYMERMPDHAHAFIRRLEPWLADKLQSKNGAELQRKGAQQRCPRGPGCHLGSSSLTL